MSLFIFDIESIVTPSALLTHPAEAWKSTFKNLLLSNHHIAITSPPHLNLTQDVIKQSLSKIIDTDDIKDIIVTPADANFQYIEEIKQALNLDDYTTIISIDPSHVKDENFLNDLIYLYCFQLEPSLDTTLEDAIEWYINEYGNEYGNEILPPETTTSATEPWEELKNDIWVYSHNGEIVDEALYPLFKKKNKNTFTEGNYKIIRKKAFETITKVLENGQAVPRDTLLIPMNAKEYTENLDEVISLKTYLQRQYLRQLVFAVDFEAIKFQINEKISPKFLSANDSRQTKLVGKKQFLFGSDGKPGPEVITLGNWYTRKHEYICQQRAITEPNGQAIYQARKEKVKANSKAFYEKNKEAKKEYAKNYDKAHPEQRKARNKICKQTYRKKNKDKIKKYSQDYYQKRKKRKAEELSNRTISTSSFAIFNNASQTANSEPQAQEKMKIANLLN
ncbi:MAG: hypothetical protein EPO11_08225 [Gammaproteobacteria bacterium]|nr:MAG: hypothetical protein EPO11_08225 [Gammaproteobacteria bacterium]